MMDCFIDNLSMQETLDAESRCGAVTVGGSIAVAVPFAFGDVREAKALLDSLQKRQTKLR